MKKIEISFGDIEQLPHIAQSILKLSEEKKIFAFYAEMGAGKTTLIKELCRQVGSRDNFSSPTYAIVNEYLISSSPNGKIYHMDLYRLKNVEEALAAGIEEYLNNNNYCFIEWPELVDDFLPPDTVKISIQVSDNVRNVSIFIH
ncbi:MAG: tRNA (adenosine(37)-N6)-threonylcarbamoyltransferase complex ATPase subunit type 1 TsaE [Bacteroidota bacterium]